MTQIIKDMPFVDRPREKIVAKGVQNLKNKELLAVLLGSGYRGKSVLELSDIVLKKIPSRKFLQLNYDDLIAIKGISKAKAATVLAAIEFSKRILKFKNASFPVIKSVKDIVAQTSHIRDRAREHFLVLYLNARAEMIFKKCLFSGTLNANLVHPREIFKYAIKKNAASVIFIHNHPSGDPSPSENDIQITKSLIEAGKIMGIDVLDHLIIAKNGVFSLNKNKLI